MKTKKSNNPLLTFYRKHRISPVHQDINNLQMHFLRREKLYRQLGLPPIVFSGQKMLEIGPGGGYNSLAFFYWGARVDFVEPNIVANNELSELLKVNRIEKCRWNLFPRKIEDFKTREQYGIIIAEGFIPGVPDRGRIISIISGLLAPGGVLVLTCLDEMGSFFEVIKRIIAHRLLRNLKVSGFNEKIEVLSSAFSAHFKTLKFTSRPVEDWVTDNLLNPAIYGGFFDIGECIKGTRSKFYVLGSSPHIFTDYSWYKDIEFNQLESMARQFSMKRHALFLCNSEEKLRPPQVNNELVNKIKEFRKLCAKAENNLNELNTKKIVQILNHINRGASQIDARVSGIIKESVELILDKDLTINRISRARKLAAAFGRGLQYVSLVNKINYSRS